MPPPSGVFTTTTPSSFPALILPVLYLCPSQQSAPVAMQVSEGQQVQIVQAAAAQGQAQTAQAQGQTMQVMQQIITNTGEIQQIPVRDGIMVEMKHWKYVSLH